MKTPLLATAFILLLKICCAQVITGIQPQSFMLPGNALSAPFEYTLPAFNMGMAERLDKEDAKNNRVPKFARSVYTNITLDNSGNWSELPNGDRLWRLQVTSEGAQALIPYFNAFYLPKGSTLHVYPPDKEKVLGAFTPANNPASGYYCTGLIHGETMVLEYYEPQESRGQGKISLNEIGHAYRMADGDLPGANSRDEGFRQSEICEINANCPEGNNWQDQKRAVVRIMGKDAEATYFCSGTMMNNTLQDCTPYLLSAQHCLAESADNHRNQWVFYFNYQGPQCETPLQEGSLGNSFVTGCTKIADSDDNGGNSGSDFLLLKLNQHPPVAYNVYYAGWDNAATAPASGVCIHHPRGDIKKISTYSTAPTSSNYGIAPNSHWKLNWATTTSGKGVTERGSSGAAIFNQNGYVVGHLSGGAGNCVNNNEPDYFGKLAYDWTGNGPAETRMLKPWLDPNTSGTVALAGKNLTCPTSIGEINAQNPNLSIQPNPSTGVFSLLFDDNTARQLSIYDATGKLVRSLNTAVKTLELDMSAYSKGIYMISIESANGRTAKKLVLQ